MFDQKSMIIRDILDLLRLGSSLMALVLAAIAL